MGELLGAFRATCDATYAQGGEAMAAAVGLLGERLLRGRKAFYLGEGALGMVGVIDASECPPTYVSDLPCTVLEGREGNPL